MAANRIPRVPVREQDPKVRAHNFEEVCYGYNKEEAMLEASRCLHCKNPRCVASCPVGVKIPDFIELVAAGENDKFPDCTGTGQVFKTLFALFPLRVMPDEGKGKQHEGKKGKNPA